MTAEFAVALPAVMAVAALLFSATTMQLQRLALFETAATLTRAAARGEGHEQLGSLAAQVAPHANLKLEYSNDFVCVRLSQGLIGERACERKGGL